MNLSSLNYVDIRAVAVAMRAWDYREISATRFTPDRASLADEIADQFSRNAKGMTAWVVSLDAPICVIGAWQSWPGMWSVFMFATDRMPEIGLPLTKFVKRSMIPSIMGCGSFNRAECKSIEGHDEAQRWLEVLGARREHTFENYGRLKETFYSYVWDQRCA